MYQVHCTWLVSHVNKKYYNLGHQVACCLNFASSQDRWIRDWIKLDIHKGWRNSHQATNQKRIPIGLTTIKTIVLIAQDRPGIIEHALSNQTWEILPQNLFTCTTIYQKIEFLFPRSIKPFVSLYAVSLFTNAIAYRWEHRSRCVSSTENLQTFKIVYYLNEYFCFKSRKKFSQ